jgi:glycosyltransferase involved in cell wall biosynthesis
MIFKIGIPLIGSSSWHGGITYVEALLRSFRVLPKFEQPEIFLLIDEDQVNTLFLYQHLFVLVDKVVLIADKSVQIKNFDIFISHIRIDSFLHVREIVDFLFPINMGSLVGFSYASWIPDLQHKLIPKFFSESDIESRNKAINYVIETSDTIVLSSQSSVRDFRNYYGEYNGILEIVNFYSGFDENLFLNDPLSIVNQYNLPNKYFICCNQFWMHKNHDNLFKALALTKEPVNLVCTGSFVDYRNSNWFSYLKELIADLKIGSRIFLLGLIPRNEQIQLIRGSIGVIQPSFFEGWSTVLEDARTLGKLVIASNIETHLEQDVPDSVFFDPKSCDELACILDNYWNKRSSQINLVDEKIARERVSKLQVSSARQILRIGKRQADIFKYRLTTIEGARRISSEQHSTAMYYDCFSQIKTKENIIQQLKIVIEQKNSELKLRDEAIKQLNTRIFHRIRKIVKPRLGNLNQYAPRALKINSSQLGKELNIYPVISIVTPSFQQGNFIGHTILSVLEQNYPNLEYYIQDGGSRDSTLSVITSYENQLSGWISETDAGQSQAINKGFNNTTGEIMAWLNSDDLLLPGALFIIADYFNRNPEIDVVYGNRLLIDENNMEIGRWILPGHDSNVLSWADYVPQETLFWRRRIWEKVGNKVDESLRFAMDWDLLVRFRDAGARFGHIPQFLGAFRIHDQQKTSAQINQIGQEEMNRIRKRILGRVPDQKEIHKAVLPYLVKHIAVDMTYRVKKRLGWNV